MKSVHAEMFDVVLCISLFCVTQRRRLTPTVFTSLRVEVQQGGRHGRQIEPQMCVKLRVLKLYKAFQNKRCYADSREPVCSLALTLAGCLDKILHQMLAEAVVAAERWNKYRNDPHV